MHFFIPENRLMQATFISSLIWITQSSSSPQPQPPHIVASHRQSLKNVNVWVGLERVHSKQRWRKRLENGFSLLGT